MPRRSRVELYLNPRDARFAERVHEASREEDSPARVEASLRHEYPEARVRESTVEGLRRWYAYRDGDWKPA